MELNHQQLAAVLGAFDAEQTVGEALKAVTAGGSTGTLAQGQVQEDLEPIARNQLFGEEDFVQLRRIPSVRAKSLDHKFVRIDSYGDLHGALYQEEGGVGVQTALRTSRTSVDIKTVSHVNKATGEAIDVETIDVLGAKNVLVSNRKACMFALHFKISMHSWYADNRKTENDRVWAGFLQQHEVFHASAGLYPNNPLNMPETYLVDMRGAPLDRETVETIGLTLYEEGWGRLTDGCMTPKTSKLFQGDLQTLNAGRYDLNAEKMPDGGIIVGQPVRGVRHQGGDCVFYVDNTISARYYHADPSANSAWSPESGAPARPAAPAAAVDAGPHAQSKWVAADLPTATYSIKYKIQAENRKGYSQSSVATAAVVAVAGCKVTLTWDSSADALGYRVLRNSPEKPTEYFEIGRVTNDGPALEFVDYNHFLPGFDQAFFHEMRHPNLKQVRLPKNAEDNAICFADLNGMGIRTKPIYENGDFKAELILTRRAPQLNQPRRLVRVINVGNR